MDARATAHERSVSLDVHLEIPISRARHLAEALLDYPSSPLDPVVNALLNAVSENSDEAPESTCLRILRVAHVRR